MEIYKLTESLPTTDNSFEKGALVYEDEDFPVRYLNLCNEKGEDILDKFGCPCVYEWRPAIEECPWDESKLELYKIIDDD